MSQNKTKRSNSTIISSVFTISLHVHNLFVLPVNSENRLMMSTGCPIGYKGDGFDNDCEICPSGQTSIDGVTCEECPENQIRMSEDAFCGIYLHNY